jgi:N-methylhydantoinase A
VYHGKQHGWRDSPVFDRDQLIVGQRICGPAVIEEMSSTTVLGPNHDAMVDPFGNLIIKIQ